MVVNTEIRNVNTVSYVAAILLIIISFGWFSVIVESVRETQTSILHLQQKLGSFSMFQSEGGKNLLFKDSTKCLQAVPAGQNYQTFLGPDYMQAMTSLRKCSDTASGWCQHPVVRHCSLSALLSHLDLSCLANRAGDGLQLLLPVTTSTYGGLQSLKHVVLIVFFLIFCRSQQTHLLPVISTCSHFHHRMMLYTAFVK